MKISWSHILQWLKSNRNGLLMGLGMLAFCVWGIAYLDDSGLTGNAAFRWMNIFNYSDVETLDQIKTFMWELRCGAPPLLSLAEIVCWKLTGSWSPLMKPFYRWSIIICLILPFFLHKQNGRNLLYIWILGVPTLMGITVAHFGNPQLYDVMTPWCILWYLLFTQLSVRLYKKSGWNILWALLAGFSLSMGELMRPFMIAITLVMMVFQFFYYRKHIPELAKKLYLYFLIPILLFSGSWHLKTYILFDQIIWSNHGGSNLSNAWAPLIDHPGMHAQTKPEHPPRQENEWTWPDLNTEVHYENSKMRSRVTVEGIKRDPKLFWTHFQHRIARFFEPQVGMYEYHPEGSIVDRYGIVVNIWFAILAFFFVRAIFLVFAWPGYLLTMECVVIGLTAFLSLMPIIGENGEEARFMISVLPMLMLTGMYGLDWLTRKIQNPQG